MIKMADPALVACPADTWTKVATAVTYGKIWIRDTSPTVYRWTYRETGGAAPTVLTDGQMFSGPEGKIDHTTAIDVYIWANNNPGQVEVWL
jgi:hypothetical protein